MKPIFFKIVILVFLNSLVWAQSGWHEIEQQARGQTVNWYMWGGFPAANAYVNGYIAPRMKEQFNIQIKQVPVQDIAEVVSKLLVEKQAGRDRGQVDLIWINGENFRTCKKYSLLSGPFTHKLPNRKYINSDHPAILYDFGEAVQGLESPWGSAQFVMIYDSSRTPQPPTSIAALLDWIQAHPGRFSYPAPPDFTGSVFIRHLFYHVTGTNKNWQRNYNMNDFRKAAAQFFMLLHQIKPNLWREGKTFPESPQKLIQMFADGEVEFAMSYHPADASRMINEGLVSPFTRTFIFDSGSIANTHFVAIPFNSQAVAAAMVVANFLISLEAQLHKADLSVWGDLPVIDINLLDISWQKQFSRLNRGVATLSNAILQQNQLPEPASDILIYLEQGWEREVLRKQ